MIKNIGNKVYILGIGGISLSAIAQILKFNGHCVRGYDKVKSDITRKLEKNGFFIDEKINRKEVLLCDTLIYTSAINENNIDLAIARENGIQVMSRAEALRNIAQSYETQIAVSGSHGKTTTTSMISTIFDFCTENLTCHVGGEMVLEDRNFIVKGEKQFFVTEACEYKRNFLYLNPKIAVILNLDLDHTDIYGSQKEMVNAFLEFSNNICDDGYLIIDKNAKGAKNIISKTKKNKKVVTISAIDELADYYVNNISKTKHGYIFDVYNNNEFLENFEINVGGVHNISNALSAIVVAHVSGLNLNKVKKALMNFNGVKRRYEKVGTINNACVILDYAHHPEEIKKVVEEARSEKKGKIFVVFQPHTYSRTKSFWSGFIKSLATADNIVLYPIYPAREKAVVGVTSRRMAEDLRKLKKICYYSDSFEEIRTYLGYFVCEQDIVLVLGAGDIEKFRDFV